MNKLIKFDLPLYRKIQDYADDNCEGKFTQAVRMIIRQFFDGVANGPL